MPTYEEKLEQAATLAAIVFSHALKSVMEEDVPDRIKEVFTTEVCHEIGISMGEAVITLLGEDVVSVLIEAGKKWGDKKLPEVLRGLNDIAKDVEVLYKVRMALVGLEVGYARPWWARWLGLPGKVKIIK